jgi:hypothetical protein
MFESICLWSVRSTEMYCSNVCYLRDTSTPHGPLQVSSARPQECDHGQARLDPYLCCYLVHLPGADAASADLVAVEETEAGCGGQSATAHRDFLPNGVAIPPAGNLPENVRELEV